ncbi:deoxyribodipyrimidine photo-lyase [Sodalis endosymbiont of Henestaris halophilus]|uniref:deoxyribodipyrimidine photo-lyase n=1 Tax=Sodalis endosymbiont of Henestaris halophilus TaxID=1929246 RepID=UPI000BBF8A4C|nr:deoxyribodipyrimidine photo-lyase [Sodalis endosymbiont of Henestaris halophilus]SNC59116.1 Deoxyribodipyrimidine photo-lyase [Sodalis endosymbiont of Henestaris halophilus]
MKTNLVWLRNDLRLRDNAALHFACKDPYAQVLVVFIATPQQWQKHDMSPRQAEFIRQHLCYLAAEFAKLGITMHYHQCEDFTDQLDWLAAFCQFEQVDHIFYNYQYEFNERERDRQLARRLGNKTLCQGFDDGVLMPLYSINNSNQQMYKVYTPFRNAFLRRLEEQDLACLPPPAPRARAAVDKICTITPFDYPTIVPGQDYPVGEEAALSRLRTFCHEQHLLNYHYGCDIPALEVTSRLSAWLAIGVLSPRQCYQQLYQQFLHVLTFRQSFVFTWFNKLIWRDFYRHIMAAWPALCRNQPFLSWARYVDWQQNDNLFDAWCSGLTGYPIVDAAMRQLVNTGWIHNRLRMISASFLVKDLLIDWRRGERYFMLQLIDSDLAANNGGWQWVASTGTDAAPYFRVFNPTTQGKRFDPGGAFIRRWLPELRRVPDIYLHQPNLWPGAQHTGLDYPQPIVDHNKARARVLDVYAAAKARCMASR